MKYKVQVATSHYEDNYYESEQRFVSYFNQKDFILKLARKITNPKILEIGKGNGFLCEYLKNRNIYTKTMDIDADLKPDYVGDIFNINKIIKEKFDIVGCFEILEHVQYTDLNSILHKISSLNPKYLIISVPQSRLFFSFWFRMNVVGVIQKYIDLPYPTTHIFNGEHYWELGKKGYSLKNFRILLSKYFNIIEEYVNPINPYHKFFVLSNLKTQND